MTPGRRRALVGAAVLGAGLMLLALALRPPRRPAAPTVLPSPWLIVYNAVGQDLTLLRDPAGAAAPRRTVACLGLPRWALRVGVADDRLVLLDPDRQRPSVLLIDLEALRRIAAGRGACDPARPPRVRVPLHAGKVPYRGLLSGGHLYVSYFGESLVEVYDWIGGSAPTVRYARALRFAGEHLGLSDLALVGRRLAVADSGFLCYGRHCPNGHFRAPRVLLVDAAATSTANARAVEPANLNAAGLYRHADGSTWVLSAGDYAGGHGSVQRLAEDGTLGPEIRLPVNAAAAAAFALDRGHFAVRRMAGEHLFIVDAARQTLVRTLRFDGRRFVEVPAGAPLPDRAAADFQDVVADPRAPDRFFFVDSRGERLIEARWRAADATLDVVRVVSLAGQRFRSSPDWAVWLR